MWCYSYMKIIVLEVKYILFAFALSAYIIAAIEKEARVDIWPSLIKQVSLQKIMFTPLKYSGPLPPIWIQHFLTCRISLESTCFSFLRIVPCTHLSANWPRHLSVHLLCTAMAHWSGQWLSGSRGRRWSSPPMASYLWQRRKCWIETPYHWAGGIEIPQYGIQLDLPPANPCSVGLSERTSLQSCPIYRIGNQCSSVQAPPDISATAPLSFRRESQRWVE